MENKVLGGILMAVCIVMGLLLYSFTSQIKAHEDSSCSCAETNPLGICPHQQNSSWQTYLGIAVISVILALGIYLIFFEKSQKAIVSALEKQRQIQNVDEKYAILFKGLNEDERKVINAVREQDGITQSTLRLRTGLHKSKLSITLDGLEKRDLIARQVKGKTKQLFLKIAI
jgi:uncharacterized membrane protein